MKYLINNIYLMFKNKKIFIRKYMIIVKVVINEYLV